MSDHCGMYTLGEIGQMGVGNYLLTFNMAEVAWAVSCALALLVGALMLRAYNRDMAALERKDRS